MRLTLAFLLSLVATDALGQGLVPNVLSSNVDQNGRPLAGAKLYVYAANTTTPQTCYTDLGLTLPTTFPVVADQTGRIPLFYCGVGSVHIRLTDASGNLIYDYPSALVVGSTSGGGGGGGSVDPSTVLSTGDIKFRQTSETLTGWIKLNGTTIGSAASGATQRANADTSALYAYLWTNCIQTHCAVTGGRGASASVDFTANKPIAVPDWRDRAPFGLDDMGASARGGNPPIGSGGSDTATTPGAWGGAFNSAITQANLPAVPASGVVTATSNPAVSGGWTPAGTVTIGGTATNAGLVTISGGWTPSGTITMGGTLTPLGTVSLGGTTTPTITTTLSGTQTFTNVVNSTTGTLQSIAVTGSSYRQANLIVDTANFSAASASTAIAGSSFSATFAGTPVPVNSFAGATFAGDAVAASSVISAAFTGTSISGSSLTGAFSGTPVTAASVIGVTAGTYSFTGSNLGSGTALATASPFILGTWYMHL